MTHRNDRPRVRRGLRILPIVLALLPLALLLAREWDLRPDLDLNDYAQYVEHARALLEGRPYSDTGYLYSPVAWGFAPRAYPPGLPLALAAGFTIGGTNLATAKIVSLLFALALLGLAGAYFGRERGFAVGIGVALVLSVSPAYVEHSLAVLSDLPFAAIVWGMLVLADREGPFTLRRSAAVTAICVLAILFRPHGLVLIPALAVWGLLNVRTLGWNALLPAPVLLAGTVAGRLIVGADALRGFPEVSTLFRHLLSPDLRYHLSMFEAHLYPFPGDLANDVLHVFTTALTLVGLVTFALRRPRTLAVTFGVVYAIALASMPGVEQRFAFPLYPLFVFGLLNGVRIAVDALFHGRGKPVSLACAVILATVVAGRTLGSPPPTPLRDDPSYRQLVDHVRERVEAGEELRIAFFRPRVLASETGAKGMVLLRARNPRFHLQEWCRLSITHVALGGFGIGPVGSELSRAAMETRPGTFTTEFRNEGYELVRIDPDLAACSPG